MVVVLDFGTWEQQIKYISSLRNVYGLPESHAIPTEHFRNQEAGWEEREGVCARDHC